jgi:hypothetical protein
MMTRDAARVMRCPIETLRETTVLRTLLGGATVYDGNLGDV